MASLFLTKGAVTLSSQALLQMTAIEKSFSGIKALKDVSFDLLNGEVHALLGANGAGKSTLMKILSGAYEGDSGTIEINGSPVSISSPREAKVLGIQCVYQEVDVALVPQLSVAENILLDALSFEKKQWISWPALYKKAGQALNKIGYHLPLQKQASELTLSEKQMVLIARAAAHDAKIIIFDEPTAPLSLEETKQLFKVIRQLKQQRVGCIFISHRLSEVFEICDRITVMRDGTRVSTSKAADTSVSQVIQDMLGKSFEEEFPKVKSEIGEMILEARELSDGKKLNNISLTVHRGEIVGVVGLVGAGKTELSKLLFGADRITNGTLKAGSKKVVFQTPHDAIESGVVLVPEERRKEGIFVEESVRSNLTIPILERFSSGAFLKRRKEALHAADIVAKLGVKTATVETKAGNLSGGNQQKVAVGKWIPTDADVYLLDEPTKGVDIGAKSDLFRVIGNLVQEGKGIVYFSCEIGEILGISDRIYVMCDGRIVKELTRGEATQEMILFYASGGKQEDDQK